MNEPVLRSSFHITWKLSVEKADKIIVLTPSDDKTRAPFTLQPAHIFDRKTDNHWENFL